MFNISATPSDPSGLNLTLNVCNDRFCMKEIRSEALSVAEKTKLTINNTQFETHIIKVCAY